MTAAPLVQPYAVGICMASVCADAAVTAEAVEEALNRSHPTGISSRWQIADEPFASGEPNPCPCNSEPDVRRHWLLAC